MANVCVITGGGSGLGLAAAKNTDKSMILVLAGRTEEKLVSAKKILEADGHEVHPVVCDVSVRRDVHELCLEAKKLGTIKSVIHAAGISAASEDPEEIIRINAIGTKNVNMEFCKYMDEGGAIVDIADTLADKIPKSFLKKQDVSRQAEYEEDKFIHDMTGTAGFYVGEGEKKLNMAYTLSKNFVVWYAQKCAHEYAAKGIRVVSVSPGVVETGTDTADADLAREMIENSCAGRMGKPEEVGFAIASIADERNGYLCGIDVLIDGGASTGKQFKKNDVQ